jgi:NodT family efflux transporter outer membrane factor (OMF) lipoprotein
VAFGAGLAFTGEAPAAAGCATAAAGAPGARSRRWRSAVLLLGLVTGGCASEHVAPPDTALPTAYEAPVGPALPDRALDRWWTLYQDAQLTALVEEALASAPDARIATARLREAAAVRSGALSQYQLVGDLNGTAANTHTRTLAGTELNIPGVAASGSTRSADANLDVSWELDFFGRQRAARRSADADLAAAVFDDAAAKAALAADVADGLFAARGLAAELEDAREAARVAGSLADAARARYRGGIAPGSDLDQAASLAERAQAQAADLEGQLLAARRSLLVLIGRGAAPSGGLEVQPALADPVAPPAALPGALLVRRPDVLEAHERLVSAMGKLKLDELALLPTFQLTGALSASRLEQTGFSATTAIWSVGGAALAPVFSRPKLMSEVHAQGARAEQAVASYEKAVQTAYGEAENALAQSLQDRARLAQLERAEADGRHGFDASSARFKAGIDSITDMLVAEQSWRLARAELTTARIAALRRSVTLFKALGGGWDPSRA